MWYGYFIIKFELIGSLIGGNREDLGISFGHEGD